MNIKLDMLMMHSVTWEEHYARQSILMKEWRKALDDMARDYFIVILWYLITFRYNKTTWYRVDQARKAYDLAEKTFNAPLTNTGLYWE